MTEMTHGIGDYLDVGVATATMACGRENIAAARNARGWYGQPAHFKRDPVRMVSWPEDSLQARIDVLTCPGMDGE